MFYIDRGIPMQKQKFFIFHIITLMCIVMFANVLFSACGSTSNQFVADVKIQSKKGDASELMEKAQNLWKQRDQIKSAKKAIKTWEKAAETDPTRADVALKLSYAYYFMATVHARWQNDPKDKQLAWYEKGMKSASRAIFLQSPKFQQAIMSKKSWPDYVYLVEKNGIEGLYWYCSNLGQHSSLRGITKMIRFLPTIKSSMERILKLDENFFHAGPHRYFGAYEAKIIGGDLNKSKNHFEKSIQLAPHYLTTYILQAELYATKKMNEELFVKLLETVLQANPDAIAELSIENRNAQRIAQDMLENIEDYF